MAMFSDESQPFLPIDASERRIAIGALLRAAGRDGALPDVSVEALCDRDVAITALVVSRGYLERMPEEIANVFLAEPVRKADLREFTEWVGHAADAGAKLPLGTADALTPRQLESFSKTVLEFIDGPRGPYMESLPSMVEFIDGAKAIAFTRASEDLAMGGARMCSAGEMQQAMGRQPMGPPAPLPLEIEQLADGLRSGALKWNDLSQAERETPRLASAGRYLDPHGFKAAPPALAGNRDFMLAEVREDPHSLAFASPELRADAPLALTAIANHRQNAFVPEELANDNRIALALRLALPERLQDPAPCIQANPATLEDARSALSAFDGLAGALREAAVTLPVSPTEAKKFAETVLDRLDAKGGQAWPSLAELACKSRECAFAAADAALALRDGTPLGKAGGLQQVMGREESLEHRWARLSQPERDVPETARAALREDPAIGLTAPSACFRDPEFMLREVARNGVAFESTGGAARDDPLVAMTAALKDPALVHDTGSRGLTSVHLPGDPNDALRGLLEKTGQALAAIPDRDPTVPSPEFVQQVADYLGKRGELPDLQGIVGVAQQLKSWSPDAGVFVDGQRIGMVRETLKAVEANASTASGPAQPAREQGRSR